MVIFFKNEIPYMKQSLLVLIALSIVTSSCSLLKKEQQSTPLTQITKPVEPVKNSEKVSTTNSSSIKTPAESYIERFKNIAISEMNGSGIPASITLAQGILESGNGNSRLAKEANNHFGIKCHVGWEGDTVLKSDDELNECFRKYNTVEESFDDHSLFLTSRPRYSNLFKLGIKDYKGWCYGLKKAGYATFSKYASALIRIIEENKLYKLNTYQYLHQKIVIRASRELLPQNNLTNSSISYSIKNK